MNQNLHGLSLSSISYKSWERFGNGSKSMQYWWLMFQAAANSSCTSIACHVGKNALGPEEQPHIYKSDAIWEAIAIQVK